MMAESWGEAWTAAEDPGLCHGGAQEPGEILSRGEGKSGRERRRWRLGGWGDGFRGRGQGLRGDCATEGTGREHPGSGGWGWELPCCQKERRKRRKTAKRAPMVSPGDGWGSCVALPYMR